MMKRHILCQEEMCFCSVKFARDLSDRYALHALNLGSRHGMREVSIFIQVRIVVLIKLSFWKNSDFEN